MSNIEDANGFQKKNTESLEKENTNKKNETIELSKDQIKNITQTKPELTSVNILNSFETLAS